MFVNLAPDEHHARGGLVAKALRQAPTSPRVWYMR